MAGRRYTLRVVGGLTVQLSPQSVQLPVHGKHFGLPVRLELAIELPGRGRLLLAGRQLAAGGLEGVRGLVQLPGELQHLSLQLPHQVGRLGGPRVISPVVVLVQLGLGLRQGRRTALQLIGALLQLSLQLVNLLLEPNGVWGGIGANRALSPGDGLSVVGSLLLPPEL
eukprot:scaffold152644_cov34-Prasinocladus_malaysianus.AAC.1